MSVPRHITARATAQTAKHVGFWFEDHPEQTSVALENGGLWVDDFDGSIVQMRKAVTAEFVSHGWVLRTIKGVKTLIKVS